MLQRCINETEIFHCEAQEGWKRLKEVLSFLLLLWGRAALHSPLIGGLSLSNDLQRNTLATAPDSSPSLFRGLLGRLSSAFTSSRWARARPCGLASGGGGGQRLSTRSMFHFPDKKPDSTPAGREPTLLGNKMPPFASMNVTVPHLLFREFVQWQFQELVSPELYYLKRVQV